MYKISCNINNSWFLIDNKNMKHWNNVKKAIKNLFEKYGSWEHDDIIIKDYNTWEKSLSKTTSKEKTINHSKTGFIIPHFNAISVALDNEEDENTLDTEDMVYNNSIDLVGNVLGVSVKIFE